MDYSIYCRGAHFTIEVSTEVESALADSRIPTVDRASVAKTLHLLADQGQVRNEQKFNHEEDGIYAVKGKQLRVYGWFSKRKLRFFICGNIDIKKRRKADPQALGRAKRLRREYEDKDDDSP